MNQHKRQVKSLWINPAFQFRFLAIQLSLVILFGALTSLCVSWSYSEFFDILNRSGVSLDDSIYYLLEKHRGMLVTLLGFAFASTVLLGAAFGVWYSHRISGPMYRLEKSFQEMSESGQLKEIHFRQGDLFQEVAKSYNGMVRAVQKDVKN